MKRLAALFAVFILQSVCGWTQDPAPAPAALRVIAKPARPFVFEQRGELTGYSVELWKRVAQEAGLKFQTHNVATVPEAITALKQQQADVAIGALSITEEREALVDFSYPYYKSGLQILVNDQGSRSPFRAFLRLDVFKILGILIVAIAVNAHILWFLERGKDSESFPTNYGPGVLNAAWWSVSILVTLGCENIAPSRVAGRLLAVVWMLAGVALYSYVTATLTTTMTKDALKNDIGSVNDLQGLSVGTVDGSSSVAFLAEHKITARTYPDSDTACRALAAGEVKAVVYDAPLLKYFLSNNAGTKLTLAGELLEKQDYGFALQERSPLRKAVNRALLKLGEEGYLDELEKKWFATATP